MIPGMTRAELEQLIETLKQTNMVAFEGEVWLKGWKKSTHSALPEVTFNVADDAEMSSFESATIKKGKQAGQRYRVIFCEINDDEEISPQFAPADHSRIIPHDHKKGGALSKEAAGIAKRSDFQRFASKHNHGGVQFEATEAAATTFIKIFCRIDSRVELDHDDRAASRFRYLKESFRHFEPVDMQEAI